MRICIVSHYFWPEISAPSSRLSELAQSWIEEGHQVSVVTNLPNHPTGILNPGYAPNRFQIEDAMGMRILRCRTYATPNQGIVKKTLGHLFFAFQAAWEGSRHLRGMDVVLASSPTLFSVIGAWGLSRMLGCPLVMEVRDLWPAIFVELGVLENRFLIGALEALELSLYRKSRHVVVVTQAFADDIIRRGVPDRKVSVIPNGVDLDRFRPGGKPEALQDEFQVRGKFVVLYVGAHGISHGLKSILETARLLRDDPEIKFVFVGEGAEREALVESARGMRLTNVAFFPGQPRDRMRDIYHMADVCLVPLRNIPLFRTFIPSKMFEIMGAGRPIAASLAGEAADILARSGGAEISPPEDPAALASSLRRLKADPARREELARQGRAFAARCYDRRALAHDYLRILKDATGSP